MSVPESVESGRKKQVMHEIYTQLSQIETENNVRILFACDAGSRAMMLHDQSEKDSSDYDVRFVYVHPMNWYLRVVDEVELEIRKKVMIRLSSDDHQETEMDFVGFELRKTLTYTKKSNPTLMEWFVQSSVIYYCHDDAWLESMRDLWVHYYYNMKTIGRFIL